MNILKTRLDTQDIIFLKNLHLSAVVGKDAWGRAAKAQPVVLSIALQQNLVNAAARDDINQTVSYGQICKDVTKYVETAKSFDDLLSFNNSLCQVASLNKWGGGNLDVFTILPKASLRAEGGLGLSTSFLGGKERMIDDSSVKFLVKDMKLYCIIGVNSHERMSKQLVVINLMIEEDRAENRAQTTRKAQVTRRIDGHASNWKLLLPDLIQTVESSGYETLESLATEIATTALTGYTVSSIDVSVEKPSALAFVEGAGVQIKRTFAEDSGLK
ncbi:trifunctional dihydropteroate synthetase [Xylographa opegraphella]|nr:trifunctional dihydropteroate synthetase [Xylographa opegraphella]